MEAYLRAYCRAIPTDVLAEVEPQTLLAFVMERFAFLEDDWARTVKVTIHDPETTLAHDEVPSTVIETRLPDCAFVIRTIKAFLRQYDVQLRFVLHPIHGVVYDQGQIAGIDVQRGTKYSQVYLQVSTIAPELREAMRRDLEARLELTLLVNRDRRDMMARLQEARTFLCGVAGLNPNRPSPRETQPLPREAVLRAESDAPPSAREVEASEAVELIDWLKDDNFILIAYAWFPHQDGKGPDRGLGLFAAGERRELEEVVGQIVATRRTREELYSYYRTDFVTVVRSVTQVRYLGVAQRGPNGQPLGEHVFIGLMSTKALKQANRRIPVVGKRIKEVMARLEEPAGSYAYTKSAAILDSMPLEDLFYWGIDEIHEVALQIRQAESKDQARVMVMRRPRGRRITVICVVPRMQFSEALRSELAADVKQFLGVTALRDYRQETDDESPIRLHFTVGKYRPNVGDADLETLTERLERLLETWGDRLRALVFKRYRAGVDASKSRSAIYLASTATAPDVWARYGTRFPEAYQSAIPPEVAMLDIELIEKLEANQGLRVAMVVLGEGEGAYTSLRIVSRHELVLNDVVPTLHRMALQTTSRLAVALEGPGPEVFITGFEVSGADGREIRDPATLERLGATLQRVLDGLLFDDRLLGLGYTAGLDWRQIDLLLTYRNYFVQVFQGFGTHAVNDALLKHPACTALLVEYFETKFRTDRDESPAVRAERLLPAIARRYDELLEAVSVIQEDLILRYFIDLFEATRRTNYYRPGRGDTISIKIESALVEHMPRPCPLYEIYVHAPGVEGIHLRGGKVARGGIRHSDRADDFRTEVLGLQRTQTLKNTVIVPTGSKGGFATRKPGLSRDEARAQYEVFIAGLLDITDNYQGTAIVPPPGVLRYDADDPYLVVAADKGTAHLSDTANGISLRYQFWLDDAFASGGSAGYDHKAMGITSRGGWTNVERHFREMGIDIRKTSIRVAGVGDMSGDVFGNGMLLNDKLKLVAAFNHKHVFVDPDPDPAVSYAERKRMFTTPGTQWSDYKPAALSKGGGVYDRAAKEIALSPEAQALLGLKGRVVSGPDLVRAILGLEVDLMWFGGIGTYVKASTESHGEVGDKVNDPVRISASELRAKVIGEGANLAITQRGRTEYALHGGRCNTDAIDNSAGVDCSDHEVNIKILLDAVVREGELTPKQRDRLLAEMTEDVAALCLRDNIFQNQVLGVTRMRGLDLLDDQMRYLRHLVARGRLDRALEFLPDDETLAERARSGVGMTTPELAVLLAYAKMELYDLVLDSDVPEDAYLGATLARYFPERLAERYPQPLQRHPLRREIIATHVVNSMVNRVGPTFVFRLIEETGASAPDIVRAYMCARQVFELVPLWQDNDALGVEVDQATRHRIVLASLHLLERATVWMLQQRDALGDLHSTIRRHAPGVAEVGVGLPRWLVDAEREALQAQEAALAADGVPATLAQRVARLDGQLAGLDIVEVAEARGVPIETVAGVYFGVGGRLELGWVSQQIAALPAQDHWKGLARLAMRNDLSALARELAASALGDAKSEREPERLIAHWQERRPHQLERCRQLLADLRPLAPLDASMLSVLLRELRALV